MADIKIANIKGPQGIQGETGQQGVPGEAATIEVGTVSTTAYGNTAQVINTGTSSEAVFDFVIPQGRPGEETTRMSALTLDTVTASSASFPVPATGENGATVWGKVIKFFNDVKSALVNKINYSDCVTVLTNTSNTLPLAASQGKALNDALAKSVSIKTGSSTSAFYFSKNGSKIYGTFLVMGVISGYGAVFWGIIISGGNIAKKLDLLTGSEIPSSFTYATFYYDSAGGTLGIYPTAPQTSQLTAISG